MAKVERDDRGKRSDSLKGELEKSVKGGDKGLDKGDKLLEKGHVGTVIKPKFEHNEKEILDITHSADELTVYHQLTDDPAKNTSGLHAHWGYHLLVNISECNHHVDNEKSVEEFLGQMVKALKMKPIGKPMIVRATGEEGRGVSGVQIITTSTLVFHGDDDEWSAYIDVFSCAPYEPKVAIDLIQKFFQPKKMGQVFMFRDAGKYPLKR